MKKYFRIADIVFEMYGDVPAEQRPEAEEYVFDTEPEGKHKLFVELKAVDEFTPFAGTPVYRSWGFIILKNSEDVGEEQKFEWFSPEHRIFMSKYGDYPAALYAEKTNIYARMNGAEANGPDIVIEYLRKDWDAIDMTFMELFSPDRPLAMENAFIMHSCYVEHNGKAVIFTAPSGTGKSTQGNLWTKYADAHVVNGDRSILRIEEDGTVMAHGLPFCGSSSINFNKHMPVKGIVFLAQGKENVIEERHSLALLKKLMSQTTYSAWGAESMTYVMDFYEHVLNTVPVIQYACTPDQKAVEVLHEYLTEKER